MDWLEEEVGEYDNDYLIIDCPGKFFLFPFTLIVSERRKTGQIELYTHHPFFPRLVSELSRLGLRTCAVYLLDSQFVEDKYKFFRHVSSF